MKNLKAIETRLIRIAMEETQDSKDKEYLLKAASIIGAVIQRRVK